jgi:hypothetical protein
VPSGFGEVLDLFCFYTWRGISEGFWKEWVHIYVVQWYLQDTERLVCHASNGSMRLNGMRAYSDWPDSVNEPIKCWLHSRANER